MVGLAGVSPDQYECMGMLLRQPPHPPSWVDHGSPSASVLWAGEGVGLQPGEPHDF